MADKAYARLVDRLLAREEGTLPSGLCADLNRFYATPAPASRKTVASR